MDTWLIKKGTSATSSSSTELGEKRLNDDSDSTNEKDPLSESEEIGNDSSESETEPLPKKQKRACRTDYKRIYRFNPMWLNNPDLKGWLSEGPSNSSDKNNHAYCKVCQASILAHKSVIKSHAKSAKHKQMLLQVASNNKITDSFKTSSLDKSVKIAELKLCGLLATNDLPFVLMDTLSPLLSDIFSDSKISRYLNIKRSKATAYTTDVLGKYFLIDLYNNLKNNYFSLIMDETTDVSVKKQCAFSVTYFNESNVTETRFFDLIELDNADANSLFAALKHVIEIKGIPLTNLIGFCADTTNVMAGEFHSVFSLLKEELPNIICIKCACHLIHLAASKACTHLPRSVEDLLRNVGSHFNRSALRVKKFEEFQTFFKTEIHKILSPAITRWLSLKACVDRVIEQYIPLQAYFREAVFEDPSITTENILSTMENKFTIIYLEFMSYAVGLLTDFNLMFQSEQPLLFKVKSEVKNLLETLCSNYIDIKYIKKQNIFNLNHKNPNLFVPLQQIYLGVSAAQSLNLLEADVDIEVFLKSILNFYLEIVTQIKKRFTFSDPIFEILEVVDPEVAMTFKHKTLKPIIDRFPCLSKDISNIQTLDNEWRKYVLLEFVQLNLPVDAEQHWKEIFNMKNAADQLLFPNLKKVVSFLLILPFSNVKVERIFSNLNNIKNKHRNCLKTSNIKGIVGAKEGVQRQGGVVTFTPTKEMLNAKPVYGRKNC